MCEVAHSVDRLPILPRAVRRIHVLQQTRRSVHSHGAASGSEPGKLGSRGPGGTGRQGERRATAGRVACAWAFSERLSRTLRPGPAVPHFRRSDGRPEHPRRGARRRRRYRTLTQVPAFPRRTPPGVMDSLPATESTVLRERLQLFSRTLTDRFQRPVVRAGPVCPPRRTPRPQFRMSPTQPLPSGCKMDAQPKHSDLTGRCSCGTALHTGGKARPAGFAHPGRCSGA